ncbi:uncharacterized protein EKO05_0007478 [Ascochyta rabiei]|uniref:uncharacterized protein n=1 Tax=Didymella rabiei TaxID=5454 RepID=UPI00220430A1|nr:uncharacterized protein EKO05_0007478 [Ascochyta rabiei]UPX17102.1 hypothetical protein EKO05_0007478 [Ascochyta rabiei]
MTRAGAASSLSTTNQHYNIKLNLDRNQPVHNMAPLRQSLLSRHHATGRRPANMRTLFLVLGICAFFVLFFTIIYACCLRTTVPVRNTAARPTAQRQPRARPAAQCQPNRRGGTYSEPPRPSESVAERQAMRETETRQQQILPPAYQLPAPTYQHPTSEIRRQWLMSHRQMPLPLPAPANDLPPTYNSAAVWPSRPTRGW